MKDITHIINIVLFYFNSTVMFMVLNGIREVQKKRHG